MLDVPFTDVIVIGGGHAGIEAALASARLGASTLLMTQNLDTIGQMSCNPAIGGPAKSQLVKEIDALGGVMGLCADASYMQMKTLNKSKGPAVQALRAQSDKAEYRQVARTMVESQANLKLRQTQAIDLQTDPKTGAITGVVDQFGIVYPCRSVVLTTGTFLNGRLWVGEKSLGGGRPGEPAAIGITQALIDRGLKTGRLKTGTPPRLDGRTIDYTGLEVHPGDESLSFFSFLPERPQKEQWPCHLTRTTDATHRLIQENLHRSPMYSGSLNALGPRYCPSIEDKVVRFADKESHHLFIEPEGRNTYEVYLQGFSTCLPIEVQYAMVATLPGLEKAEMLRPACAVEYDYFPAYQLTAGLMCKTIAGLFMAGQINGTSGYEEAAAQGLMAGINACRYASHQSPFVLTREQAYIGTLIDDLVTKEIHEPYRMLTSRSEYRLLLRQDNADVRLTPVGKELGLVDAQRWQVFQNKQTRAQAFRQWLEETKIAPSTQLAIAEKMTLANWLRRPTASMAQFWAALEGQDFLALKPTADVEYWVETELKYQGYVARQTVNIERLQHIEHVQIPANFNYHTVSQLANEARDKLSQLRPETLGQAARMSGVTPADIGVLQLLLRKTQSLPLTDVNPTNTAHEFIAT